MFLGFIRFTNLGLVRIPNPHNRINAHYGLFHQHNNEIYGHVLSSNRFPFENTIQSYYVHVPNINGLNKPQYLWDRMYKFDGKLISIIRKPHVDQYLIDHYDKFKNVLTQINPNGNFTYLAQQAIDLSQYIT